MNGPTALAVRDVGARIQAILREHRANMTEDAQRNFNERTLNNYYVKRLEADRFFSEEEEILVTYIAGLFRRTTQILEICSGLGQLTLALRVLGYSRVTCCEINSSRHNCHCVIDHRLNNEPDGGRTEAFNCGWETISLHPYKLIVCTNAVSSHASSAAGQRILSVCLAQDKDVIYMPGLYGDKTTPPMEFPGYDQVLIEGSFVHVFPYRMRGPE